MVDENVRMQNLLWLGLRKVNVLLWFIGWIDRWIQSNGPTIQVRQDAILGGR